jgi:stage III sporulation protein AG
MKAETTPDKIPGAIKKYGALGLVILVGLVLLLWPRGAGPPDHAEPVSAGEAFDLAGMERRMEESLSSISGAGKVDVLLSLKTGMEVIIVQDADTRTRRQAEDGAVTSWDDERQDKTVLAGGAPIIQMRHYPVFRGALIVCEGADNAKVHAAVLDAVSALTGLRADAITIAKRKA